MNFLDKKQPKEYRGLSIKDLKDKGLDKYIDGISDMQESERYLFFRFQYNKDGYSFSSNPRYVAVYDKFTNETIVSNGVVLKAFNEGGVGQISGNYMIYYSPVSILEPLKYYPYKIEKTGNKKYDDEFLRVVNNIKEDDNFVLFVYKLKQ